MKWTLLLLILIGLFLRIFELNKLMPFIGDYAWYYLSARDMLLTGNIPLVGITASRTWLHQGPLWTYIVAFLFQISKFSPLAPAYFIAVISTLTIPLVYYTGLKMFNERTAVIGALFFTFSPFAIIHGRMPYHTSLLVLFSLLFLLSIFLWIHKDKKFFFFVPPLLALLYHFELVTIVYIMLAVGLFIYGKFKKASWTNLNSRRYWIYSVLFTTLIMLPILIYDITHGFPQTVVLAGWVPYRILKMLLPFFLGSAHSINLLAMSKFLLWFMKFMFFLFSGIVGSFFFFMMTFTVLRSIDIRQKNWWYQSELLLLYLTVIPLAVVLLNDTPAEGYIIMLIPLLILLTARGVDLIAGGPKRSIIISILVGIMIVSNLILLLGSSYYVGVSPGYGARFDDRKQTAKYIMKQACCGPFKLKGEGPGSEFESYTMNIEYLLWYLGKPSQKSAKKIFTIYEDQGKQYVK